LLLVIASTVAAQQHPDKSPATKQRTAAAPGAVASPQRAVGQEERRWPRTHEYEDERRAMVAQQIEGRGVRDANVLDAMRNVPRHWFVPEPLRAMAHGDGPLPIGEEQTISQPYIVALMTESLRLTPESKVLEIGTGSGYQAAVIYEITPNVFTIEIVEPLARRAIETFKRHGYEKIQVRIGDGYAGWPEQAPFDAIIVTCAPDHVPPRLAEQLQTGGRMCIPVGDEHGMQELHILTKDEKGNMQRRTMIPVRFVPMTGEAQKRPAAGAGRGPGQAKEGEHDISAINEEFKNPNLAIEPWLERWESESREIYTERAKIVQTLDLRPGMQVADVGAGTGLFVEPLSRAVGSEGRVYAVDIAPRFIEHIKVRARRAGLANVEAILSTEESVTLPDQSVDLVLLCDTYHHFANPAAMLHSIHQSLRPRGRLVVVDFERIPGQSREWVLNHVRAGKDVVKSEIGGARFVFLDEVKIDGFRETYLLRFERQ
jgi:protein-L-isoaspartate(D-aspartate) O-methyltransferase